jgi:hypothetical protein
MKKDKEVKDFRFSKRVDEDSSWMKLTWERADYKTFIRKLKTIESFEYIGLIGRVIYR